jgi:BirA family biotin operon repressor/biotin-[acetyl-CoA-carboxylase] ligase
MEDGLSERAIVRSLKGAWGRPLRLYDQIGSTNADALRWAWEGAREGALVVADHQSSGRGRAGRSWASSPGAALQFSVVLRPAGAVDRTSLLPTVAGLACAEGVESRAGVACSMKWPNDVIVAGRKLAGILVETHLEGTEVRACVAGIGVNCHWQESDLPPDLAASATSIDIERRRRGLQGGVDRAELLAAILERLEHGYRSLADKEGPARILERVAARSSTLGRDVRVKLAGGEVIEGRAVRLSPWGGLVLGTESGEVTLEVGEVEAVRGL